MKYSHKQLAAFMATTLACEKELKNTANMYCGSTNAIIGHWENCYSYTVDHLQSITKRPYVQNN